MPTFYASCFHHLEIRNMGTEKFDCFEWFKRWSCPKNAQLHEDNITLVMIIIILILLVCHTPDGVVQIVASFVAAENRRCGTAINYAVLVCNLLIVLNSSSNFILYYFMRRGFRKVLLRKLCGCVKGTYNSTSTVLNNIGYSRTKLKLSARKSCPDFKFFDNGTMTSIEAMRKTSV